MYTNPSAPKLGLLTAKILLYAIMEKSSNTDAMNNAQTKLRILSREF